MVDAKDTTKTEVKSTPMPKAVKLDFEVPDIKDFLKTGAQFGHQTKRWNPKMGKYIHSSRGDIHIIDLSITLPLIENALKFLVSASSKGNILFVATKRQASEIIKDAAIESGSYYITHRWPGGFFTNHSMIQKSLNKLKGLENDLKKGVEGRTKYEVTMMKKDWSRLNRLYEGVKNIKDLPKAIVVIDPNYEKKAIREAKLMGIPVIAMIDTNCDPEGIQYPIPANDDAVKSVKLIVGLIAKAIKQGNEGKGIEHDLEDYSKIQTKLIKSAEDDEEEQDEVVQVETTKVEPKLENKVVKKPAKKAKKSKDSEDEGKGMLGKSRESKTRVKIKSKK